MGIEEMREEIEDMGFGLEMGYDAAVITGYSPAYGIRVDITIPIYDDRSVTDGRYWADVVDEYRVAWDKEELALECSTYYDVLRDLEDLGDRMMDLSCALSAD